MKLRITSDGTPNGTSVETEDGQMIEHVTRVEWMITNDGFARAFVELVKTPVNITLDEKNVDRVSITYE